jgi:hypothetical protein
LYSHFATAIVVVTTWETHMKTIIGTLLLCAVVSVMSYKAGVQDEHERGHAIAAEDAKFAAGMGWLCGRFQEYDPTCFEDLKFTDAELQYNK